MNVKDQLLKEKDELLNIKKPYETAAFIIFGIFFIQQMFYLFMAFIRHFQALGVRSDFIDAGGTTYKVYFNYLTTPNLPVFVGRVLNLGSDKFIWVALSLLFLALWYGLIWLFVWNYCRKRGLAKWTWTALIAFGPAIVFNIPMYLIFAVYVFRPYIFRFIRRGVDEYKKYNEKYEFSEEKEEIPSHEEFEV